MKPFVWLLLQIVGPHLQRSQRHRGWILGRGRSAAKARRIWSGRFTRIVDIKNRSWEILARGKSASDAGTFMVRKFGSTRQAHVGIERWAAISAVEIHWENRHVHLSVLVLLVFVLENNFERLIVEDITNSRDLLLSIKFYLQLSRFSGYSTKTMPRKI